MRINRVYFTIIAAMIIAALFAPDIVTACDPTATPTLTPTKSTAVMLSSFTYAAIEDEPGNISIVLDWATETEVNTIGFELYRDDVRVSDRLIPAKYPGCVWGGEYRYIDKGPFYELQHTYMLREVFASDGGEWYGPAVFVGYIEPATPTLSLSPIATPSGSTSDVVITGQQASSPLGPCGLGAILLVTIVGIIWAAFVQRSGRR